MTYQSITIALLGLGLIGAPAFAAEPARPGTVNYVEGAASIDGQPINAKEIGNIDLEPGQELTTGAGKVEVLLTPGVFLRVDANSTVKMIAPDLTLTQVQLEKGRAGVEVDEIHDQNNLQIIDAGVTTRLKKTGYYEFDANHPQVMVFKGKADVEVADGKGKEVKGNHELALADNNDAQALAKEKPAGIDRDNRDDLFNWSKLRSQYLSEANNDMAGDYGYAGYPGWYWDPYLTGYTFIGAGPFYSPFGWGFYPFGWGGGWYGGYYGRGPYRGYYHGYHGGYGRVGVAHGYAGGGFHGGAAGGFHGGAAGGFHGGGGGGHR